LSELLKREPTRALFDFLAEVYFESGISGVQPKVMIPNADQLAPTRATVIQPDLIVKAGGAEFPHLTSNEFLGMDAARRAGIRVPGFWLSEDGVRQKRFLPFGLRVATASAALRPVQLRFLGSKHSQALADVGAGAPSKTRQISKDWPALQSVVDLVQHRQRINQANVCEFGEFEALLAGGVTPFAVHAGGMFAARTVAGAKVEGRRERPILACRQHKGEILAVIVAVMRGDIEQHQPVGARDVLPIARQRESEPEQIAVVEAGNAKVSVQQVCQAVHMRTPIARCTIEALHCKAPRP